MSGFGHRVYKNYDPRAKVIKKLADEVFSIVGRDPLIEVTFPSLCNFFIHVSYNIIGQFATCIYVRVLLDCYSCHSLGMSD